VALGGFVYCISSLATNERVASYGRVDREARHQAVVRQALRPLHQLGTRNDVVPTATNVTERKRSKINEVDRRSAALIGLVAGLDNRKSDTNGLLITRGIIELLHQIRLWLARVALIDDTSDVRYGRARPSCSRLAWTSAFKSSM